MTLFLQPIHFSCLIDVIIILAATGSLQTGAVVLEQQPKTARAVCMAWASALRPCPTHLTGLSNEIRVRQQEHEVEKATDKRMRSWPTSSPSTEQPSRGSGHTHTSSKQTNTPATTLKHPGKQNSREAGYCATVTEAQRWPQSQLKHWRCPQALVATRHPLPSSSSAPFAPVSYLPQRIVQCVVLLCFLWTPCPLHAFRVDGSLSVAWCRGHAPTLAKS